jgi:hypothetical protein
MSPPLEWPIKVTVRQAKPGYRAGAARNKNAIDSAPRCQYGERTRCRSPVSGIGVSVGMSCCTPITKYPSGDKARGPTQSLTPHRAPGP